ncbi:Hypothetical predicted protein [Mytilus galloprovincialis]|uniref:CCHC-type domain-containing protein n=1 Tax=Mytilus galloprovincialis TaxID=29158 RepID=A0A8B6CHK7_MYTGA|nr:Hypothetical predicted protein [Mytilus galloprovincialis]
MSDIEPDKLPDMEDVEMPGQAASNEITNADLLLLMKTYFTRKLTGIERNFADTTHDLARKIQKSESFQVQGAVKKLKTVKQDKRQNINKRPAESAGGPSSIAHNGNNGGFSQQQPFLVAGAAAPITSRRNKARDIWYNCGLYGHWAKDCKKGGNSTASRGAPN